MRALIVGAGRIGTHVISFLSSNSENQVTVIEKNKIACRQISDKFDTIILNADVSKPGILEKAEASQADLILAATDDDRVNLAITQKARSDFGIPKIVSVANSPKSRERLKEAGADVVISPVELALKDLENTLSMEYSTTIMYRPDSELEVIETTVPGNGSVMGRKLSDLTIPEKCRIVLISRDSGYMFPDPELELKPGDKLLILGDAASVKNTVQILTATETA